MDNIEQIWTRYLNEFGLECKDQIDQSRFDPYRRIYVANNLVYKCILVRHEFSSDERSQDLTGEHEILKKCDGIRGVPSPVAHHKTGEIEVLVLTQLPGDSLERFKYKWFQLPVILLKLSSILFKLSWRGVSHNDILPGNVLVTSDLQVSLIDFDQATMTNCFMAMIRQFTPIRIKIGEGKMFGSLGSLIIRKILPVKIRQIIKNVLNRNKQALPYLPENANPQLKNLHMAWKLAQKSNASSPGRKLAYYSYDYEGYHFPGERDWQSRFDVLRKITNFKNKRILELGCNMALLSCSLLKDEDANHAMAVDLDDAILEAARNISLAFGVKPVFKKVNFDDDIEWDSQLIEYKPDIVFALNVLNWVKDKQRLLNFLGRFPVVIFEGHDSVDIEMKRLQDVGFNKIEKVGISERERDILFCEKSN